MSPMPADFDSVAAADRNGLETLTSDECMHLLSCHAMGRVAVTWDVLPVILPVNYALDGERVVLRTAAGTKLCAALSHSVVAFEIDDFEPVDHSGWSVLVRGPAREITDREDLERARRLPLRPWGNESADRYMAIQIEMVSGRRTERGELR